jgi:hypothetical protein
MLAGASGTDTVDAIPASALVVRVIGPDGKPAPNVTVRFTPTQRMTTGQFPSNQATMLVAALTSATWTTLGVATTNDQGDAAILVRMGTLAGAGAIIVGAPALGFTDTATFTVQPGTASRLVVAPADTTVYIGGTVAVRAQAVDRYQNARADAVTLSTSRPVAAVQGTTVTGADIGRARITATAGTRSDTMGISIVPRGTIVAQAQMEHTGIELALYIVDLDGRNLRKIVSSVVAGTGYFGELPPVWSTDGKSVFYHDNKFDHTRALWVVDVATGVTRRLPSGTVALPHEAWPAVSPDGRWVYYNGSDFEGTTLFRIDPTGTTREQVGPAGIATPTVSSDGRRVAALGVSTFFASGSGPIVIYDLATKVLTKLNITAQTLAWSPVDNRIAYLGSSNDLRVVNADGTGDRALATDAGFSGRIAWSPDGKYVIAHRGRWFGLVTVATGEVIPISFVGLSVGLLNPSWKP